MMLRSVIALLIAGAATAGVAAQAPSPDAPFASEIAAFTKADRSAPAPRCATLFVGSSSIRLWQTLAFDMAPYPVVNRGFGGSTIADVNLYFDQVVAPYRPRAIFFYAGENDINAGKSPAQVVSDFAVFLRKKDSRLGRTPVIFISLKPSKARFAQLSRQSSVNAAVRRLAGQRRDLQVVDVASAMLGKDGRPRDIFQDDQLHMTAEGYRIWTRILRPKVAAAAKRPCGG
ncbi:hypothetical protein G7077_00770 [Sphingomonas piscis]|uniref:SGNH hydrolase-type esterase domain-containing protein n=1 Tax=Sphingomonas piscis TaxID=2714943 RepID=A0A6G7YLS7_9SPHN|nr:GDSL-type esterase/lipase family protein [Sphingomonas piscis]QIK77666.1 hypothetical protein G7077_00770 [Sphingomonas piscis]